MLVPHRELLESSSRAPEETVGSANYGLEQDVAFPRHTVTGKCSDVHRRIQNLRAECLAMPLLWTDVLIAVIMSFRCFNLKANVSGQLEHFPRISRRLGHL